MTTPTVIRTIPSLAKLENDVDYFHVHSVTSPQNLREFVAASLSYMPGWMRFLYHLRKYFVRLLGTRQTKDHEKTVLRPEDLSFTLGDLVAFFTTQAAEENKFWLGEARDDMISGHIAFVYEPGLDGMNQFHLITTATYLHWTARIYFIVIRPFHHLVVYSMARHALSQDK
ncbi:DUF2867 domain-containing protein [Pseudodesulfovibrio sediminis]|uniref:DUF2867 domain-containing protein n=1 Tax=Pseudodesulfovibrio sediminis TaxID=2810563 RepID=A0ABN6EN57_9BACT|nr:DUF2867 domain-containing protein [Pseudodesulfovibrio sediminis]BCS87601.1 hypothetical protein PSDVSF_08430 [Pseudodesulfovibrio sediminis]